MSAGGRLRHQEPFDFRFSHRYPATKNIGLNVFADESYIPGKWYHLVCVRDHEYFSIYLNGQLKNLLINKSNNDPLSYKLYVGNKDPGEPSRQYFGLMDELALYDRPLTKEEISKHFDSVKF